MPLQNSTMYYFSMTVRFSQNIFRGHPRPTHISKRAIPKKCTRNIVRTILLHFYTKALSTAVQSFCAILLRDLGGFESRWCKLLFLKRLTRRRTSGKSGINLQYNKKQHNYTKKYLRRKNCRLQILQ